MQNDIEQAAEQFQLLLLRLRRLGASPPPPEVAQISPSLMTLIDYVAVSPHCGIKEMAKGLNLSTPTVSVGVRQLEQAGFIDRQTHPHDKRAVQIFLTPKGQELYERTHSFRRQTFERLLAALSAEERAILIDLFEKAITSAEKKHSK